MTTPVVTLAIEFAKLIPTEAGVSATQNLLNRYLPVYSSNNFRYMFVLQCMAEGWSDKLKDQAAEGCNLSGRIRVNKVAGNIHLSPGRSFQTSTYQNVYELVPYLRDEGHRHDFSHTIHQLGFFADDEYDQKKLITSQEFKKKMGIITNPLDQADWQVTGNQVSPNCYTQKFYIDSAG
jgi:Endoplasmic reticulum vesicle transporter